MLPKFLIVGLFFGSAAAGLTRADEGNYGMGVAVGGHDNDGHPDLYVTAYGKNIVYLNRGDGTYLSASDKRVHFGLGSKNMVDVDISWPSGNYQVVKNVKADQILEVREAETK
jgi:hypothetical protein